jgi:hypothetical protein
MLSGWLVATRHSPRNLAHVRNRIPSRDFLLVCRQYLWWRPKQNLTFNVAAIHNDAISSMASIHCSYAVEMLLFFRYLQWSRGGDNLSLMTTHEQIQLSIWLVHIAPNSVAPESEGESPHSQQPATGPYPKPVHSTPTRQSQIQC